MTAPGPRPSLSARRVASSFLRTWTLSRMDYRHLLRAASMRKRQTYLDVLKKIPFLRRGPPIPRDTTSSQATRPPMVARASPGRWRSPWGSCPEPFHGARPPGSGPPPRPAWCRCNLFPALSASTVAEPVRQSGSPPPTADQRGADAAGGLPPGATHPLGLGLRQSLPPFSPLPCVLTAKGTAPLSLSPYYQQSFQRGGREGGMEPCCSRGTGGVAAEQPDLQRHLPESQVFFF